MKCDNCVKPRRRPWEVCVVDKKHPNWRKVGVFLSFQTSITNKCQERAEKCADYVQRWLLSSTDVVASDAEYYGLCKSFCFLFWKNLYLPERTKTEHKLGHPSDNTMKSNAKQLCKWLDKPTELFTVSELHAKISSFAEKDLFTVYNFLNQAVSR